MAKYTLKESYEWMAAPEFKIVDTGKNTVTIRGVAVKKGDISRNRRKYVDEELRRAARTWIGKPVTINHAPWSRNHPMYDGRKVAGNVRWMEYNKGAMEYQIDINKQPYVDMIRSKSAEIQGVSIEADYIYNRCSRCGKHFYTQEEFENHMVNEEFIKNFNYEPHQMLGRAVSVVLYPEEPGVQSATLELMEKYQRPKFGNFSQLLETVTNYQKEKENYMKKVKKVAVVQKESRQVFDKQLREQDLTTEKPGAAAQDTGHPSPDEEAQCVAKGGTWNAQSSTCVMPEETATNITAPPTVPEKTTQEQIVCEPGFKLDPDTGMCVVADLPTTEPPTNAPAVNEPAINIPKVEVTTPAPILQPALEQAEPTLPVTHPAPEEQPKCLEGSHWDEESQTCIPDEIPEVVSTQAPVTDAPATSEFALPPRLKLGEPFADYADFADCVAKNKGKAEDPEAYCAEIKRQVEGETVHEMYQLPNAYIRDIKLAEQMNHLTKALAKLHSETRKTKENAKRMLIVESKLRHGYDKSINVNIYRQLKQLRELLSKQTNSIPKYLSTLATAVARNKKLATEQKRDFEKILAVADKNVVELKQHVKSLEQWKKAKEQEEEEKAEPCPEGQHRDPETGECVPDEKPEAEETKKKLEEMATKLDNLEEKLKGDFKAHTPSSKHQKEDNGKRYIDDPMRKGKK